MPGSNPILRHWQIQVRTFSKNLLLLRSAIAAEPVHDLRVAIKKIRSYLKLCAALTGSDFEASLSKTEDLFSSLGKSRNIEISKQLLLTSLKNDSTSLDAILVYLQLLQDQVNKYCLRITEEYDEDEIASLTVQLGQLLKDFTHGEIVARTKNLISSSMENVKHDMKHFTERSHLVRKELKNIFYWARIFEDGEVLEKTQIKSIDKTLEHLGNIQDKEVVKSYLKNFRKTILSKGMDEYETIRKIEGKAEKKKNILLEKARRATEVLVNV